MRTFFVAVEINAPPTVVWSLVADAASYASWNSTVNSIDGEFRPGATISLYAKAMPDRPFKLAVKTFEPPRRMVLEGGMPLGLFVGTRRLEISPAGSGGSRFEMAENWHGPLSPLMSRLIPDQQPSFETFAADLKRAAERA